MAIEHLTDVPADLSSGDSDPDYYATPLERGEYPYKTLGEATAAMARIFNPRPEEPTAGALQESGLQAEPEVTTSEPADVTETIGTEEEAGATTSTRRPTRHPRHRGRYYADSRGWRPDPVSGITLEHDTVEELREPFPDAHEIGVIKAQTALEVGEDRKPSPKPRTPEHIPGEPSRDLLDAAYAADDGWQHGDRSGGAPVSQ